MHLCKLAVVLVVALAYDDKYPFTPRVYNEPIVNCTTDNVCNHGWCRHGECMCDTMWATYNEEACSYRRYKQQTALLLQIFLGWIGVGIGVLDWVNAMAIYWGSVAAALIFSCLFFKYADKDDSASLWKGVCSACAVILSAISILGVWISTLVFIAGDYCMDGKGVKCG